MHYQVVARPLRPDGAWEYYPYWTPVRDRDAATRLANYAAQAGYEAAILQSVTVEMLQHIAHGVVGLQDAQLLPALRYLPGASLATASRHRAHSLGREIQTFEGLDPYVDGPDKAELDRRRLTIELGPGGDVTQQTGWRQLISIPCRMDLLRSWMSMRQRLLGGLIGGPRDGEQSTTATDQ